MAGAGRRAVWDGALDLIGVGRVGIDAPGVPEPVEERREIVDAVCDEVGDLALALELVGATRRHPVLMMTRP